ncbi:MAG: hypothetical protein K0Q77_36 [Anaerosporomusa subterranea]|nr:hypothetical protein [Anaerosporomusa subterranea]
MPKCSNCGVDVNITPEYRYNNDPMFHRVVDTLLSLIIKNELTPIEVREAANYAAYRHEILSPPVSCWGGRK